MTSSAESRVLELRDASSAELEAAIVALDEAAQSAVADAARRLATGDVDWSLRLAAAVVSAAPIGSRARVRALAAQGHALSYRGEPATALLVLREALEHARAGGDAREIAGVQLAKVQPHVLLGEMERASEAALAARDAFRACGDDVAAAMAEANLGVVLRRLDRPEDALACFDRARVVLQEDPVRSAMIDSNRAEALLDLDRFGEALVAFEAARDGFDAAENSHAAALVEGNLADLRSRQGRPDLALRLFERARRRLEAIGDDAEAERARLLSEEAECLARIGARRESMSRFRAAAQTLERAGLAFEAARSRLAAAGLLLRRGDPGAAAALSEASASFESLGNAAGVAQCEAGLAALHRRNGQASAAVGLLERALGRVAQRPMPAYALRTELALALLADNRAAEAQAALAAGDPLPEGAAPGPLKAGRLFAEGCCARARGDLPTALERFRSAVEALERVHAALPSDRYRYAYLSEACELNGARLSTALDLLPQLGAEPAFDAIESASARGLLDLVAGAPDGECPGTSESHRLRLERDRCREAVSIGYSRVGLGSTGVHDVERLRGAGRTLEQLEEQLERIEARLLADGDVVPECLRPMRLSGIQAGLAAEAAIVQVFVESGGYGALIVRPGGVTVRRGLVAEAEAESVLRKVFFLVQQALMRSAAGLSQRDSGEAMIRAAGPLHERLARPLLDALGDVRRVGLVLGPGAAPGLRLALGPLAPHANGPTFVQLPSATLAVTLPSSAPRSRAHRALAVGVSDDVAPGMGREAMEIARVWQRATALTDSAATAAAFADAAARADVIHVALHSVFSPENPNSSRLRFADRWLDAREIAQLRLGGAQVVLAGCETGRSEGEGAEERGGLVRAFLAAGASAVTACDWPLHDAASLEIFSALHRLLHAGGAADPARCLADVQRDCAARGVHPALWAGLFTVGGLS
ncbi:MAG: CHAT domain-containing protein [Planctomycetia bacterium]|nr:MAG: CHAT domain-containing protein [Planctomycetia bacterium]